MTDVTELIVADHERLRRLFAALDDVARDAVASQGRRCGPDWALAAAWGRIATLLGTHADAEQEMCFLPMFGGCAGRAGGLEDAIADLDDIREALAETRLVPVGCRAWWYAVSAARRTACRHIWIIEHGPLARFHARSGERLRRDLARQWQEFTAARRLDKLPPSPSPGPELGPALRAVGRLATRQGLRPVR